MEKRSLIPRRVIDVQGRLSYSEGYQACNRIRFKKELLEEFYQLKEKRSKFSYRMLYCRTFEELEKTIKEFKEKRIMPVLMCLYKEE